MIDAGRVGRNGVARDYYRVERGLRLPEQLRWVFAAESIVE